MFVSGINSKTNISGPTTAVGRLTTVAGKPITVASRPMSVADRPNLVGAAGWTNQSVAGRRLQPKATQPSSTYRTGRDPVFTDSSLTLTDSEISADSYVSHMFHRKARRTFVLHFYCPISLLV